MVDQAQRITSESLSARLPNPNPADEFGQLATVFNDTLRRLESSFNELKRFTADASHELRTPLTALRAVGEVALRDDHSPSAQREAILSMLEEAQRLDELMESLLALARLESSKALLRQDSVNVAELAQEAGESLSVLAADRGQTITVSASSDLLVAADRVLLRQSLLNIVHNAIRNAPDGTTVAIRTSRANGEVSIEVSDRGPGIAPEHQARIFERFFRIDHARTRAQGGHGLGLAIAKQAVERQGGRIEVESELGVGSTFRIVLPQP
jgi:signal transduction histidine kinase